jgi:hypothetical protein
MGDRGHRKGQLRVLGSPSALRTKEPRAGGPPGRRGVRGSDFFVRKSLDTYLGILKPACGLWAPRANRTSIGNILATSSLGLELELELERLEPQASGLAVEAVGSRGAWSAKSQPQPLGADIRFFALLGSAPQELPKYYPA